MVASVNTRRDRSPIISPARVVDWLKPSVVATSSPPMIRGRQPLGHFEVAGQ